jgi:bifunctional N-acetylglucosamine-1-phosphate-uridyltransferase/glucosamine-1-phosphate-acetyltransferase GlmU-like protein
MAFLKEECGRVIEIKEKECYTDCHTDEHASTGTYFFARGKYVKKYFRQAINENLNHGGEHYVTLVYNLLIRDGLKVGFYDTPFVSVFGTPEEIQNFEAWQTIINGGQVKTTDDLLNSYEYWKKFLKEGDVYNAINIS